MFCNDIIGPLVKRVLRKLGIREEIQSSVFVPQVAVEIPANTASNRVKVEGLGEASWVVGEQYRVIWDGVPYDLVLKEVSSTSSWLYLGNGKPYGKEDTGEPFCVSVSASYTYGMVADFADNSVTRTHTLKVEQVTETTTPIDPKYLPGVCLPVFDFSHEIMEVYKAMEYDGTNGVSISAEKMAIVNKAVSLNLPLVMSYRLGEYQESYFASFNGSSFDAYGDGITYYINVDNGQFCISIEE